MGNVSWCLAKRLRMALKDDSDPLLTVAQGNTMIQIDESSLKKLKMLNVVTEDTAKVNAFGFSSDGRSLICSADDDTITVYDCSNGSGQLRTCCRKYGADQVAYTHSNFSCLHSSTKCDDAIRYLSLSENKYIRFFAGHTKKVINFQLSPVGDIFLSSSLDRTVRMWDLRVPSCQAMVHLPSRPLANFDPDGLIFAIALNSQALNLYDLRAYQGGPFSTFLLPQDRDCDWTSVEFSSDGKYIVISTNGQVVHMIDAFSGTLIRSINERVNGKGIPLDAYFTPDDAYILSGSTDGSVHFWNHLNGTAGVRLHHPVATVVSGVKFNPLYFMMVSACAGLNFWFPEESWQ